jgi:hypothetical protein
MATEICNPLVINITFASDDAAADRTYTATRQLRMYDLKLFQVDDGVGAITIQVFESTNLCITMESANPPRFDLSRLGQATTANLLDETNEVVAPGGTIVFNSSEGAGVNTQAFLYCWAL